MKKTRWLSILAFAFIAGCAGFSRGCSSCIAENFAADWVVVQYGFDGKPFNCWKLKNTSITNEASSDGIYWLDQRTGHLVHISGWYNRVQVERSDWESAAGSVGVDLTKCADGKYVVTAVGPDDTDSTRNDNALPAEQNPPATLPETHTIDGYDLRYLRKRSDMERGKIIQ